MSSVRVAAGFIICAICMVGGCRSKQETARNSAGSVIAPADRATSIMPVDTSVTDSARTTRASTDSVCCAAMPAGHDSCAMSDAAMDSMRRAMHRLVGGGSVHIGQMQANCPRAAQRHQSQSPEPKK